MSWPMKNIFKRENGTRHEFSSTERQIRYKRTREPEQYDPGQFEYLHGNEACAREWQDAQMDLRKIK